ncbi:MAG: LLM class F420-dependent oxidoreductase [Gammaproteobacteria bacterium]|nr:LLM class F420-dependent oxidoreductase [Gammaproteobacteria bacterium]
MKFGVVIFPTDKSIQPVQLAQEVEARGLESLWFPEHSHIPTSRETPWGGRKGAPPLPECYWRSHDQLIALAACAGATTKLRLGTGITLVAQRDPLWLAKEVASLDMISGGRFELGIGYGWCVEEMRNHGLEYSKRRAILREKILAMKELWTKDEASYAGEYVNIEKSWAWPKPVQRPHPPITLGGAIGPRTADHIAEFCDGWMPISGRYSIDEGLAMIGEACRRRGRDPQEIRLGMFYLGAVDQKELDAARGRGAVRAILPLPSEGADQVLPLLDQYAKLSG